MGATGSCSQQAHQDMAVGKGAEETAKRQDDGAVVTVMIVRLRVQWQIQLSMCRYAGGLFSRIQHAGN